MVWIKDADRMNDHAANAFLKTLEEPPVNTKIVMTTSNLGELLPTILSRCVAIRCDIPDDVPDFDLPPHLLHYAGPTIGMRLEVASRRDLYEAWFQVANSVAKSTYASSLKLAEDAKALVDKAPVDGARNQNAWSLEALAGMLTVLQVPSTVLDRIVEAHRYVLGNVNAQLVWDVLLVNATRERMRARLS
jgi:DNA polymerase-3 subunit delta'